MRSCVPHLSVYQILHWPRWYGQKVEFDRVQCACVQFTKCHCIVVMSIRVAHFFKAKKQPTATTPNLLDPNVFCDDAKTMAGIVAANKAVGVDLWCVTHFVLC